MKNLTLLAVVISFLLISCRGGNHQRVDENQVSEENSQNLDTTMVETPVEITPDSLFYSEMYNKDELVFSSWKDSVSTRSAGEGGKAYTMPILIQRGETKSFYFYFQTTNERWSDSSENEGFDIYFKFKGTPEIGKTLEEDQIIKQRYDWHYLSNPYLERIKKLIFDQIKYPEKVFIHANE